MGIKRVKIGGAIFLIAVMMFCLAAPGYSLVQGDIKRNFRVGQDGLLTLETDLGSIEVKTTNRNEVEVEVIFRNRSGSRRHIEDILEDFTVDFDQRGDDVYVKAEYLGRGHNFWDNVGRYLRVEFYVTVPRKYHVDLKTSGGGISVDDLDGEARSKTSGGSLTFGSIEGKVYGRTSGGSITLDDCGGEVDVKTSGGSISIGHVTGDVLAHTSGGSIHVDEVMGSIDAGTSGGSVTATISEQPKDDCRLTTSGGTINVYLAKDINVYVDAGTSGGRVRTEFPVTIRGEISKRKLRAKINDGGPELYLRTSGGSIYINEL